MNEVQISALVVIGAVSLLFLGIVVLSGALHIYHAAKRHREQKFLDEYHEAVQVERLDPEEAYRRAMK